MQTDQQIANLSFQYQQVEPILHDDKNDEQQERYHNHATLESAFHYPAIPTQQEVCYVFGRFLQWRTGVCKGYKNKTG